MRERSAKVGLMKNVHEKFRELIDAFANGDCRRILIRLFKEDAAHRRASARRSNDPLILFKDAAKPLHNFARVVPISGIEGGLTAASLLVGIDDRDIEFFQNFNDGNACFREELVDKTRNEQGDFFAFVFRIIPMRNVFFKRFDHFVSTPKRAARVSCTRREHLLRSFILRGFNLFIGNVAAAPSPVPTNLRNGFIRFALCVGDRFAKRDDV